MENLKLEVGKFYRTRNGLKAECVYYRAGICGSYDFICIVDNNYYAYRRNGFFSEYSIFNITSEWEETPEELFKRIGFDPSCLPAWANWIAMYENGKWVYFENEPEQMRDFFYAKRGGSSFIPDECAPKKYTGDWTDSKFKVK